MKAWPSAENEPVSDSDAPIMMGDFLAAGLLLLLPVPLLQPASRAATVRVVPTARNRARCDLIPVLLPGVCRRDEAGASPLVPPVATGGLEPVRYLRVLADQLQPGGPG